MAMSVPTKYRLYGGVEDGKVIELEGAPDVAYVQGGQETRPRVKDTVQEWVEVHSYRKTYLVNMGVDFVYKHEGMTDADLIDSLNGIKNGRK
jgi:hypothetical protein